MRPLRSLSDLSGVQPLGSERIQPPAAVAILRDALTRLGREPHTAAARAGLTITDIVDVPAAAYRRLLEYEREAIELDYPVLA